MSSAPLHGRQPGSEIINRQANDTAAQIAIPAQLLTNTPSGRLVITNEFRSSNTTMTTDDTTIYTSGATLITWNGTPVAAHDTGIAHFLDTPGVPSRSRLGGRPRVARRVSEDALM
ncbi:MAG: hypothetical protein ACRELB_21465 [Polyangiaceae bacterium]